MAVTTIPAPLDRRLMTAPAPFDAELVDEILGDHGPCRVGSAACKGCGFLYQPGARDCPSVIYALGMREPEQPRGGAA